MNLFTKPLVTRLSIRDRGDRPPEHDCLAWISRDRILSLSLRYVRRETDRPWHFLFSNIYSGSTARFSMVYSEHTMTYSSPCSHAEAVVIDLFSAEHVIAPVRLVTWSTWCQNQSICPLSTLINWWKMATPMSGDKLGLNVHRLEPPVFVDSYSSVSKQHFVEPWVLIHQMETYGPES
jgi:hypothetical protein